MEKLISGYIGKTVLTIHGDKLGVINNLTFDRKIKLARNLLVFNDDEDEFQLPLSSIFCHGEDIVLMKSFLRQPYANTVVSPLRLKCYDINGKFIGVVDDIALGSDGKAVDTLIVGERRIAPFNLVSAGRDAVIFDFSDKPIKPFRRKTNILNSGDIQAIYDSEAEQIAKAAAQTLAAVQAEQAVQPDGQLNTADNFDTAATGEQAQFPHNSPQPQLPHNLVVGAKLLIGRKVKKDIFDRHGNLLIKNGVVITLQTVNLALASGKLFELTVNSLGNLPV